MQAEKLQNTGGTSVVDRPPTDNDEMDFEKGPQDLESLLPCDEATAESLFRKMMRRFEVVRNVSSPVYKLITIHRKMNELMAAISGAVATSGPHEADNLIVVVFYLIVSL